MNDDPIIDELDELADESFASFGQTPWGLFAIAASIVVILVGTCFLSPISYLRGDTDLFGNYRFIDELTEERERQTGLELVHAQLFPQWLITAANASDPASQARVNETYEELKQELESDELVEILADIRQVIEIDDLDAAEVEEFTQVLHTWNTAVREQGEPYFITGSLVRSSDGDGFWIAEFYRELYRVDVMVDALPVVIRVAERADYTNIVESYLGAAQKDTDDALVVVDRILDFVVDQLWPLFEEGDGVPEPDSRIEAAFVDAVRAEARTALGDDHYEVLAGSANLRRQMREAVESIHDRHECGHTFRIREIPWHGYDARTIDQFDEIARADRIQPCERITYDEAHILKEASRTLQGDPGFQAALEALVSWITQDVAVHEARHIADSTLYNGLEEPLPCPSCGDMSVTARAELSAYTASLAWGPAPATSLFQACTGARSSRPHRQAISHLVHSLGRLCDDEPSEQLGDEARQLEEEFFERSEAVLLPADYPERIPIRHFR